MPKTNISNLTKQDISKEIHVKQGLSFSYTNEIVEDIISILKELIKSKKTNIKNFGSFRIIRKKERLGRSPITKKNFIISARKSLSFIVSKKLSKEINKNR